MQRPVRRTKVCATVTGATPESQAGSAEAALKDGADLVEFRVDSIRDPSIPEILDRLSPFSRTAVFTVRARSEGGSFPGSEADRLALIGELAGADPAFLDLELRTIESGALPQPLLRSSSLIVSWHAATTPSPEALRSVAEKARRHGGVPKLVPRAQSPADNLAVLQLYDDPHPSPIAFCMGEAGLYSRIAAIERGTPVAYAHAGREPAAPGQLSISAMLAARERLG